MECDYLDRGPKYLLICTVGPRPFEPNQCGLSDLCKGDYTQCPSYIKWG